MAPSEIALQEKPVSAAQRIVNDFSIQVATVNGSGSQTANLVLLRSIFGMGVPVSGKNLFPSNIAGLPTWFTIRANKDFDLRFLLLAMCFYIQNGPKHSDYYSR